MAFWVNQDLEHLETTLNLIAYFLDVNHPKTLKERFGRLREVRDSQQACIYNDRTCQCSGGIDTITVLKPHSDETICLAPVVALIQGSDHVLDWIYFEVKKAIFKEQTKVTNNFALEDETAATEDDDGDKKNVEQSNYPECNLDCTQNEWFDGKCFVRFVSKFKVMLYYCVCA